MKHAILIITIITLSGCKQISKSVEETFHPADSVQNKEQPSDEYEYSDTITTHISIHTSITIESDSVYRYK
ncbi:hypothetical protein SAMN05428988_5617 [Chitinophaga sp. YR573]|nr:hypothetical protein SAMN05428988_5617 [Chitinophaga sp. YR573]